MTLVLCETHFSFKRNLIVMYEIWFSALRMFWSLQAHRWKTNSCAFSSAAASRSEWTPARRRNSGLKLTHRSAENTVLYIIINIVWAVLFGLKRICSKLIVMLKNVRQRPLCWFFFCRRIHCSGGRGLPLISTRHFSHIAVAESAN